MDCMVQAFTGVYGCPTPRTPDEILERVGYVLDLLPAQAVIIGWHSDRALYEALIDEVHMRGKKIFLWMPVFSEMSSFEGIVSAVDFHGVPHARAGLGDEDFSFLCPSHKQNLDKMKGVFENHFSGLRFDGVLLDKIRCSSFANGFESAMGCFCDACEQKYRENGVDLESILALMCDKNRSFLAPTALHGMRYTFDDPDLDAFFQVRADIITKAVLSLVDWFQERDLAVGLDVFAPVFAYWVGQDIEILAQKSDFIKPMLYRVTDAPAGLPFESRHMREELRAHGCCMDGCLENLWGVDDLCGDKTLQLQMEQLKRLPCPTFVGMEINHKPGVCSADEFYVRNTANLIANSGLGCVLSWDVLSDTQNHLDILAMEGVFSD